ncbi:MAG: hypothetical protein QHJ82_06260 [Verrucomicrobiota bacterium]|nr:hypothetical protein [Verrucomicrobiota bacterium]
MRIWNLLCASAIGAGLAAAAWADWNPGDPYKMERPMLPDETQSGRDVLASYVAIPQDDPISYIIADDWRCSETGPITDIHIWGSWLNDRTDPQAVFYLSIYTDSRPPSDYSRPGDLLKTYVFLPEEYTSREWTVGVQEGFLDPDLHELIPEGDSMIFQYNFFISDPNPVIQQQGNIYWLAVQADVHPDTDALFGWKTAFKPLYEDVAVFGGNLEPGMPPPEWFRVYEDQGNQPMYYDMAFIITTPEPQTYGLIAGLGLGVFGLARRFLRK